MEDLPSIFLDQRGADATCSVRDDLTGLRATCEQCAVLEHSSCASKYKVDGPFDRTVRIKLLRRVNIVSILDGLQM